MKPFIDNWRLYITSVLSGNGNKPVNFCSPIADPISLKWSSQLSPLFTHWRCFSSTLTHRCNIFTNIILGCFIDAGQSLHGHRASDLFLMNIGKIEGNRLHMCCRTAQNLCKMVVISSVILPLEVYTNVCINIYSMDFATVSECKELWWFWKYENIKLTSDKVQQTTTIRKLHGDVTKWKHFPRYWPFVRGIHRSPVNSPHKCQWRRALMYSLICAWINGWVNNREAGDLRRHRARYDVTVMVCVIPGMYCVRDPWKLILTKMRHTRGGDISYSWLCAVIDTISSPYRVISATLWHGAMLRKLMEARCKLFCLYMKIWYTFYRSDGIGAIVHVSEVIPWHWGKIDKYQFTTKYNKARTVCVILWCTVKLWKPILTYERHVSGWAI